MKTSKHFAIPIIAAALAGCSQMQMGETPAKARAAAESAAVNFVTTSGPIVQIESVGCYYVKLNNDQAPWYGLPSTSTSFDKTSDLLFGAALAGKNVFFAYDSNATSTCGVAGDIVGSVYAFFSFRLSFSITSA